MALFLEGTACRICGKPMKQSENRICFPNLIANPLDSLYFFNDSCFHQRCLEAHQDGELIVNILKEEIDKSWPPTCIVCNQRIESYDDLYGLCRFTSDQKEELYLYNQLTFHKKCIHRWGLMDRFYLMISKLRLTGRWDNNLLDWLLKDMNETANLHKDA